MKKLFICTLLVLVCFASFGQNNSKAISINGQVIDSYSKVGVPFASVWIEGTYIGVATDSDGNFFIKIPNKYKTSKISFSAVGYSSFYARVDETAEIKPLIVSLQPKLFLINEVNVEGKSLVLQRILRNAVDNISSNYIQKAFSFDCYYKAEDFEGEDLLRSREAVVCVYDEMAYHRSSVAKTFKAVNYEFNESRRSFENKTLADGSTLLDDLLSSDIVRNTRNILDKHNLAYYELTREADIYFEGDSLVVIAYKSLKNDLSIVGQAGVKSYAGKIYINKTNYAIVKNELTIKISDASFLGKSIVKKNIKENNLTLSITTTYGNIANHYYLRGVSYDVLMNDSRKRRVQLIPLKINISNPNVIIGRDYYENEKMNEDYWERFSIVFEGEE